MTASTLSGAALDALPRFSHAACLRAGWQAAARHYRIRRELIRLSSLPPRLVEDMGLDPAAVVAALESTLDAVQPLTPSLLLRPVK